MPATWQGPFNSFCDGQLLSSHAAPAYCTQHSDALPLQSAALSNQPAALTYACHLSGAPSLQLPHRHSTTAMAHSKPQRFTSSRNHTKPKARNSINT